MRERAEIRLIWGTVRGLIRSRFGLGEPELLAVRLILPSPFLCCWCPCTVKGNHLDLDHARETTRLLGNYWGTGLVLLGVVL
jgi:hypothetical protein